MSLPVYRLDQCAETPDSNCDEVVDVIIKFQEKYRFYPDFVVRSPGRVNLIGEHIDYEDFSVLPMAIDKRILCAVRVDNSAYTSNNVIWLFNEDPMFAERSISLPADGSSLSIDSSVSDWSNYFKCGFIVAQKYLKEIQPDRFVGKSLKGLQVYIQSNIPTGSGLSSSAAFVCTVTTMIIRANMGPNFKIPREDLMKITVIAEHYVGVRSGGMDQAACICGQSNNALFVEFKPKFKVTPLEFPTFDQGRKNVKFLIANTLVVSNKFETAPINYNLRVVENSIATQILAFKCGLNLKSFNSPKEPTKTGNLNDFMNAYFQQINPNTGDVTIKVKMEMLTKLLQLIDTCFPNGKNQREVGYTLDETTRLLNCSNEDFTRKFLLTFPIRFQTFKLYQRAKHVYSEALRVLKALQIMQNKDKKTLFEDFGNLMNQSQDSCKHLYNCSCPEIDEICTIAKQNGSYGSRLTGAGWGGSTVHLISSETDIGRLTSALTQEFYKKRYPKITETQLKEALIVSRPSMGTCIYEL